ncbi:hypothetical protein CWR43_32455 [Rhizobium sullae]|uniref:Uncharacterized protein n=1 Tax=Rhizobium sullae TaxID=50338 RepID=A0A2N0D0A7_RHISU|nr:hypothetical protein CWR43_32455 [Rhizobium sullae]
MFLSLLTAENNFTALLACRKPPDLDKAEAIEAPHYGAAPRQSAGKARQTKHRPKGFMRRLDRAGFEEPGRAEQWAAPKRAITIVMLVS